MLFTHFRIPLRYFYFGLLAAGFLMAGTSSIRATPGTSDPLITWLNSQPVGFREATPDQYLRSGNVLLSPEEFEELKVEMASGLNEGGRGTLFSGTDSYSFSVATMPGDLGYFVFGESAKFDKWISGRFPDLVVPVAEEKGIKLYSYPEMKKEGEKRFNLALVLHQIGIPAQEGGNLAFGNLENFRDALGSCLVQWVIAQQEEALPGIVEGRMRAVSRTRVQELKEGEAVLAGSYQSGKFVPPVEPRTNYLWLFLGMVAGGSIMGLVVWVIGRGKKVPGDEKLAAEGEKVKAGPGNEADDSSVTGDQEVKDMVKGALNDHHGEGLEKLQSGSENPQQNHAFQSLLTALTGKGAEVSETVDGSSPVTLLQAMQRVLKSVAVEMQKQGSEDGHDYLMDFRLQLSDWIPALEGLRIMAEENDSVRALEMTRKLRREMEANQDLSVMPLAKSQAVRDLKTVLDREAGLREQLQTPDPARAYLAELDKRYGRLTEQLAKMADPPTAEEQSAWLSGIIRLALHLNDFMRVYLGKPHSDATRVNPGLITSGGTVSGLQKSHYQTFTENIAQVPRAVRNLRAIARDAGVRSLDDVLVEGYFIPPTALQD